MSDKAKRFHAIALKSSLFKGHADWYYCFLKAERIAHVLAVLGEQAHASHEEELHDLAHLGSELPVSVAHMAAGEYEVRHVLSDIFALITTIRLMSTRKLLTAETARILLEEYEALAEKLDASERVSPFVSSNDFAIPLIEDETNRPLPLIAPHISDLAPKSQPSVKDSYKGHMNVFNKDQEDRSRQILEFVLQNNGVSIKDIASVVKGCSEKTIQRELGELIRQGKIQKVGERRWSLYMPIERSQ